jgi:hypothetical protein
MENKRQLFEHSLLKYQRIADEILRITDSFWDAYALRYTRILWCNN